MAYAIGCTTLGAIGFALSLLATQRSDRTSSPLVAFLLAAAVLVAQRVAVTLGASAQALVMVASLPAAFLLGPTLWFYVGRLTGRPDPGRRAFASHLLVPGAAAVVALGFAFLSASDRTTMLVRGDLPEGGLAAGLALATFVLVVLWAPHSGLYLFGCLRSLVRHRNRLEQVFASTGAKERSWLRVLAVALFAVWLTATAALLSDNLLGGPMVGAAVPALMGLMMIWCLALWALRCRPKPQPQRTTGAPAKYGRSALSDARAARLVRKIDAVMVEERLFMDPDLNLSDLAGRLGATRNHVSQALNGVLGETFFDYVHRYRIEAARQQLIEGQKTVLEIATEVGFHARSSFYTAFKKVVGMTPSEFRKKGG